MSLHNANDDFVPNFDLGMDEIMASFDLTQKDTGPADIDSAPVAVTSVNLPHETEPQPAKTIPHTDDDIHDFLIQQKAKSTTYKDAGGTKRLQTFLRDVNPHESRMFHELSKAELDTLMSQFFMFAKKQGKQPPDDDYQPDTLTSFRNAWQRVIADKGLKFDIKKDPEFKRSRNVLEGRRKQLTKQGLGNKPNAARALEQHEVDKLYETGFFGTSPPISSQRTMWWKISLLFGYRGRDESTKLLFCNIKLVHDELKNEDYLEWDTERSTKTRSGGTAGHQRSFNPTAHH